MRSSKLRGSWEAIRHADPRARALLSVTLASQIDPTVKEQDRRIQAASMHDHDHCIIDCMHCVRVRAQDACVPRRCSHPWLKPAVQQKEDTATSTKTDSPRIVPSTQSFLSGSWNSFRFSCGRRGVSPSSSGMLLFFILQAEENCAFSSGYIWS